MKPNQTLYNIGTTFNDLKIKGTLMENIVRL